MKSELFVINCIKSSERAYSALAELMPGTVDVDTLVKHLQNNQKLDQAALHLKVKRSGLFEHFQQAIIRAFGRRSVPQLKREYLERLQETNAQRRLAEVFGCKSEEALQTLLSVPALQETLHYLTDGRMAQLHNNARYLLGEILKPSRAQRLELDYSTNANNWEQIVAEEHWLSQMAVESLANTDRAEHAKTPYQALAELLSQVADSTEDENPDPYKPNVLGALGLMYLRLRMSWVISRGHDQSLEDITNASRSAPALRSLHLLEPLLQVYEFGWIAKGLEAWITRSRPLAALLPDSNRTGFSVDQQALVVDQPLIFAGQPFFKVEGEEVGTFEIKCDIQGQHSAQTVLRAQEVPVWLYEQLKKDVPKLTCSQLSPVGDQLYQRILNTEFPLLDPAERLLLDAVKELGAPFFQAVALSRKTPLTVVPELWRGQIAPVTPYRDLPAPADPLYPVGFEQIVENYQRQYGQKNIELRIIQGLAALDGEHPES